MDHNESAVVGLIPNLEIEIRDAAGRLIDVRKTHNIITTSGLNKMRTLLGYPAVSGDGYTPKFIAIGSGSTAPALGDVQLGTEVLRKEVIRRYAQSDTILHLQSFVDTTEANGGGSQPLYETGLFSVLSGGTLWSRAIHTLINKTSAISITYNWRITFANYV